MPRLLLLTLIGFGLLSITGSQACEKHLNGHQSGSDMEREAAQR